MNPGLQDGKATPFFLAGDAGPLFAIHVTGPAGRSADGVLFCPPFADEMNRSRRSVALQSRRMAALGYQVLLIDPFGTGDSAGEFRDATWDQWLTDILTAHAWLRAAGCERVTLWGLRLGAWLALQAAGQLRAGCTKVLLWQPVLNGRVFMTQYLRLQLAAQMLGESAERSGTSDLRARIAAGTTVEVGGYPVTGQLLAAIDALDAAQLDGATLPPLDWVEIVAAQDRPASAASRRQAQRWEQDGTHVRLETVAGLPFWSTPEIAVVDGLLRTTDRLIGDPSGRDA